MDKQPEQRRVNVILDSNIHNRLRHEAINRREPMALVIETALQNLFNQNQKDNHDEQH